MEHSLPRLLLFLWSSCDDTAQGTEADLLKFGGGWDRLVALPEQVEMTVEKGTQVIMDTAA